MRIRRLSLALFAMALLIVGIAIGLAIPRAAHLGLPGSRNTGEDNAGSPWPGRNVYSADIRNDDHVRREQRKLVEMLEQQCRNTRQNCDLAKASRKALTAD